MVLDACPCPEKIVRLELEMIQVISNLKEIIGFDYPDGHLKIKHNTDSQMLEAFIECEKFLIKVAISIKIDHAIIFRSENKQTSTMYPPFLRGIKTLFKKEQIQTLKNFFEISLN